MGWIRELGAGKWQVSCDVAPVPVTLRRRRRSVTVTVDRTAAEGVLARVERELAEGGHAGGGRQTVESFAAEWFETLHVDVEPSTEEMYRDKIVRHVLPTIGKRRVTSIRGRDFTAIYSQLLDQGLAGRSVLHVHRIAHRMFGDAVKWGVISRNPVDDTRAPSADKYLFDTWTAEEVAVFVAALEDDRWRPAWLMGLTGGMRRGELLGSSWASFTGSRLRISQTVTASGRIKEKPKTRQSIRTISIDPATMGAIEDLRAIVDGEHEFFGDEYHDHGLVVCWEDGRPIRGELWSKWFRKKIRETGLRPIRYHDLRTRGRHSRSRLACRPKWCKSGLATRRWQRRSTCIRR